MLDNDTQAQTRMQRGSCKECPAQRQEKKQPILFYVFFFPTVLATLRKGLTFHVTLENKNFKDGFQ